MYKKSKVLREIREEMCNNGAKLGTAQRRAGLKSVSTLHLWRKRPLINRYITECVNRCEDKRDDAVEDAFFKRLVEGRGNASDYEFYLVNRNPDKWKKNTTVVNNTNVVSVNHGAEAAFMRALPEKDLDASIDRIEDRRKATIS